jgi:hypothetical protein
MMRLAAPWLGVSSIDCGWIIGQPAIPAGRLGYALGSIPMRSLTAERNVIQRQPDGFMLPQPTRE